MYPLALAVAVALADTVATPSDSTRGDSSRADAAAADTARATSTRPDSTQPDTTSRPKVPFGHADFTWMNGTSRQKEFPLTLGGGTVTPSVYLDTYFAFSGNRPRDNTIPGGASVGRHGEFQINLASVGASWNYKNVIGRLELQTGSMLNIVQDLDGSVARGRNLTTANLRNVRQATIGYHFDKAYGVDVEAGIFASYIGLESYLLGENWNYHRSLVCDFTPFYFQGARVSIYPTQKLKIEPWVMNGFQTYGRFNQTPAVGLSTYYRPTGSVGLIANFYYGNDTPNDTRRVRFHHDNSILVKYLDRPQSAGISKMAFSLNTHYGFQAGGSGPGREDAYMAGAALANRTWFAKDRAAFTVRAETITNPTRYLAPSPTPAGFLDGGTALRVRGLTTTLDLLPNDIFTFRLEWVGRRANTGYFAGRGGTTSASGYAGDPAAFTPDVARYQNLFITSLNFRM